MKKIYVVQGSTGEYSDHKEWLVRAFISETAAQCLILKLTEEANRLKLKYGNYLDWKYPDIGESEPNTLDPDFRWDVSGVNYIYLVVDLDEGENT